MVIFLAFLDLERNCLFLDGHYPWDAGGRKEVSYFLVDIRGLCEVQIINKTVALLYLMKLRELGSLRSLYFNYEEIARALGISAASARVSASRYVRQGLLLRFKKNVYVLREVWNRANREEKFVLANLGQTPSYISLMTALDYYEMTTQVQRDSIESVAIKRTKEILLNGSVFRYTKVKRGLYFGFKKEKGVFIATPEKALLDAFYLMSYGRYALDLSALDGEKFDRQEIKRLSGRFPLRTRNRLEKHGYLETA